MKAKIFKPALLLFVVVAMMVAIAQPALAGWTMNMDDPDDGKNYTSKTVTFNIGVINDTNATDNYVNVTIIYNTSWSSTETILCTNGTTALTAMGAYVSWNFTCAVTTDGYHDFIASINHTAGLTAAVNSSWSSVVGIDATAPTYNITTSGSTAYLKHFHEDTNQTITVECTDPYFGDYGCYYCQLYDNVDSTTYANMTRATGSVFNKTFVATGGRDHAAYVRCYDIHGQGGTATSTITYTVTAGEEMVEEPTRADEAPAGVPTDRDGGKLVFIIIVAVVLVGGGVLLYSLLTGGDKKTPTPKKRTTKKRPKKKK